jgi:ectoine hydroxylase-related dioxygenase (phytanoyl-CoA dioxygenase family)
MTSTAELRPRTEPRNRPCIEQIESEGYCVIPQVFSQSQVSRALAMVKSKFQETQGMQSERMPFLNKNQPMLYNLQNKDRYFVELLFGSAVLHEILKHFLNDPWFKSVPEQDPNYILRSYLARSSNHQMPMHIDSFIPYTGPYIFIMQFAMILENQDESNGCTVLVPRSHVRAEFTNQDSFNEAVPVISQAGDVVLWDSRIWHGAHANMSGHSRWSIIATFGRWWIKQAFDIPGNVPQEIYETLSDSQKAVLGFCSVPYPDETFGIDMKRNYDLLPQKVADYRY